MPTKTMDRTAIASTGNLGGSKYIYDSMPFVVTRKPEIVTEDIHGIKTQFLRMGGRFQYADKPNANGRIYERAVLEHAVKDIQEDINGGRVIGELDHPADAKVHMDRVSHKITKLWMESNGEVFGEFQVLKGTLMGNQLAALIENNVMIGISSRGVGDMESFMVEGEEYMKVMPGYMFITFDVVHEPSVRGSFMSVMESKDPNRRKKMTRADLEKAMLAETKKMHMTKNKILRG